MRLGRFPVELGDYLRFIGLGEARRRRRSRSRRRTRWLFASSFGSCAGKTPGEASGSSEATRGDHHWYCMAFFLWVTGRRIWRQLPIPDSDKASVAFLHVLKRTSGLIRMCERPDASEPMWGQNLSRLKRVQASLHGRETRHAARIKVASCFNIQILTKNSPWTHSKTRKREKGGKKDS